MTYPDGHADAPFTILRNSGRRAAFATAGQLWRQIMSAPTSQRWALLSRISDCCKAPDKYLSILLFAISVLFIPSVSFGQDGHHGVGHETWHEGFYSKLVRKDTNVSCCNLSDCRPTQSRMVDDHYEVKVDGAWLRVPKEAIQNVSAPDGGAHVCAPEQVGAAKGKVYCVVLPPET
jgi:hypothetical protein